MGAKKLWVDADLVSGANIPSLALIAGLQFPFVDVQNSRVVENLRYEGMTPKLTEPGENIVKSLTGDEADDTT